MKTPEGVDTATEELKFQSFSVESSLELTPRQPTGHPLLNASHLIDPSCLVDSGSHS